MWTQTDGDIQTDDPTEIWIDLAKVSEVWLHDRHLHKQQRISWIQWLSLCGRLFCLFVKWCWSHHQTIRVSKC